ncbi:MAG: HNH endonuclease [Bacteroidetes bacterium]|nr:HNH endonuclease [Bacteroidota bacterium]
MKRLSIPSVSMQDSYKTCISGVVNDDGLRKRLEACCDRFKDNSDEYFRKGCDGKLYSIVPIKHECNEDPVVVGEVIKSELVKLYDYYMVNKTKKSARKIYDQLILAANEKCPFCGGIGRPKNLDHFLPKAHYPQFSVFPLNLVPACRDCNMDGKGNIYATSAEEQVLHPYLDNDRFFNEQWIFARVIQSDPCVLEFYVKPPECWDDTAKSRIKKHFKSFDLADRYGIQAAEELSILIDQRKEFMCAYSPDDFGMHLRSIANSPSLFVNHWRKVMHQALAGDTWFCSNKF